MKSYERIIIFFTCGVVLGTAITSNWDRDKIITEVQKCNGIARVK